MVLFETTEIFIKDKDRKQEVSDKQIVNSSIISDFSNDHIQFNRPPYNTTNNFESVIEKLNRKAKILLEDARSQKIHIAVGVITGNRRLEPFG